MFAVLNAQDRSVEDWKYVVEKANPRLSLGAITKPPGSHDSMIEVLYN